MSEPGIVELDVKNVIMRLKEVTSTIPKAATQKSCGCNCGNGTYLCFICGCCCCGCECKRTCLYCSHHDFDSKTVLTKADLIKAVPSRRHIVQSMTDDAVLQIHAYHKLVAEVVNILDEDEQELEEIYRMLGRK